MEWNRNEDRKEGRSGKVRVWMDGCFDMVHFGHANAMRQAKEMGDYLIVGVHSDEEIERVKGPTVTKQEERYKLVRATKWVDEVIEGVPYGTTLEILNRYNMDFCVHGDDILPKADGSDPYEYIRKSDRLRECKRSGGISTTDLVYRMLKKKPNGHPENPFAEHDQNHMVSSPVSDVTSDFLLSTNMLSMFSTTKSRKPGDRVVYVDGAFDMFHVGHVDFLEKAALEGDCMILGLHNDKDVKRYKGADYPIMNLYERVMCALACKFVSDVIIGAPYEVTQKLLDQYQIDVVCHGHTPMVISDKDPYALPKKLSKFKLLDSKNNVTTETIVERVLCRRAEYEDRNKNKEAKESMILQKFSHIKEQWASEKLHNKM